MLLSTSKKNEKRQKIKTSIGKVIIILFFIIASIFQGLYFFNQYITANVMIILYAGYIMYTKRDQLYIDKAVISLFVFTVLYILSIFYGVNKDGAMREALRVMAFLPAFIIGMLYNQNQKEWVNQGIILSGIVVSLIGLITLSGLANIDGTLYQGRIQSTFHYANVTAIYLMMGIILSLKAMEKDKHTVCILHWHSLCIYLLTCGLILTYSRGVWIIFTLMNIFLLLSNKVLDKLHKGRYIFLLLLASMASFLMVSTAHSKWFWMILVVGAAISMISKHLGKWIYAVGSIGMTVGIIAAFFYKNEILDRITDISFGATEWKARILYYKGALKLIADYPFFGAGAMGWADLCEKYAGDYVKYVHNYLIQVSSDIGIIGVAFLIIFITSIFIKFFKNKKKDWYAFFIVVSILIHSLIDVDMHFQLIAVIFFIYSGIL